MARPWHSSNRIVFPVLRAGIWGHVDAPRSRAGSPSGASTQLFIVATGDPRGLLLHLPWATRFPLSLGLHSNALQHSKHGLLKVGSIHCASPRAIEATQATTILVDNENIYK